MGATYWKRFFVCWSLLLGVACGDVEAGWEAETQAEIKAAQSGYGATIEPVSSGYEPVCHDLRDPKCGGGDCKGNTVSEPDGCSDLSPLPSCAALRAHNAKVEKHAGGKLMDFVPTNVAAFAHYETEYTRRSTPRQVLSISSTSISTASLAVDNVNAANLKLCLSTGSCGIDPMQVASPVGKKVATGLSVAGKVASAATAWLFVYEVASQLNDASCTLITKKYHKVKEAKVETIVTSACTEDEEVPCNLCGDTEKVTSSEPVKSLDIVFTGELWKNEDMDKGQCTSSHREHSHCGKGWGDIGWCIQSRCGSGPSTNKWIDYSMVWNYLQAHEWAKQEACNEWAEAVHDQYNDGPQR